MGRIRCGLKGKFLGVLFGFLFLLCSTVWADPPLVNVEGVGGIALNPLAYVVSPAKEGKSLAGLTGVGLPQIGVWKINVYQNKTGLHDSVGRIDWLSMGMALSFMGRVEVGYSRENVDIDNMQNVGKDNFSLKVNLIKEKDFGIEYMPAISVGLIYKTTNWSHFKNMRHWDDNGIDYYVVASKMFAFDPVKILLNAGLLSTNGIVRGVLGFGDDRDTVFFGNIEIFYNKFVVGFEFEDGYTTTLDVDHNTHSMWDIHLAYRPVPNLMLIGAYGYTGDKAEDGWSFGKCFVLSLQYFF